MAELTGQYNEGQTADEMLDQMHEALSKVEGTIQYEGHSFQPSAIQSAIAQLRAGETAPLDSASAEAYTEPGYGRVEDGMYCKWLLSHLTDRQRDVIERRYGFRTGYPQLLDTIGAALGISYQAAQRLHDRALEKLRKIALSDYATGGH